ncbi:MAG TPA: hypothetical protein VHB25_12680 [Gemmatimonadaceae bacterium]|nr:hypothetical protein [Gemmatimonadaceae bacterium]
MHATARLLCLAAPVLLAAAVPTASSTASNTASRLAAPLPGHVVDITVGDFFIRAPDSLPAGLTTFRMSSLVGDHMVWVFRLHGGHTVADLVKANDAGTPKPPWADNLSGPGFAPPHGSANATMILEPGEYAMICFVTYADGQPHYRKGMFHRLVVTGGARPVAKLPHPDVVVSLVDHRFQFSRPLHAGSQLVRIVNRGHVLHEFKLYRVPPGHSAREYLTSPPKAGAASTAQSAGAVATLLPGDSVLTTLQLSPGEYALFCEPQLGHGMTKALRIAP